MLKRIKYRLKVLHTLMQYANGVKRYFFLLFLLSAISVGLDLATPVFYKIFIDDVILNGAFSKIVIVIIGYLIIYFLGVIIGYIKYWANYKYVNTTLFNARMKILNNLLELPFAEYENASIGDMKMRIDDDTNQIGRFSDSQTVNYLFSYITLIVSMIILFIIEWKLSVFSIIAIPLTFWLDNTISKREKLVNEIKRKNTQAMSSWLHVSVQGWREIKALNLARHVTRRFYNFIHVGMLCNAKWINFRTARIFVIPKIKDKVFMQFGLYFIGGFLIIMGKLQISDLLVFAMYYGMLSNSVNIISSNDAELQSNMPYTDRLIESLKTKENNRRKGGIVPNDSNTISFANVSFAYPNTDNAILSDFNLEIKKGERIAITGKSGCGKTTLLKLMTNMITPTNGKVSFAGIDLNDIDLNVMHSRFGFVMQENMLFNTTIRENLLYGKNDASDDEIKEACKKAYIIDFIDNLPEGYDTIIGEKGIKLSGGQRQRLVLARLFLRNVEVFIFDEATSALDQYSENIIHDAIRNIAKDKTIIVVAHRESSIRLCDRKIVMG